MQPVDLEVWEMRSLVTTLVNDFVSPNTTLVANQLRYHVGSACQSCLCQALLQ
jgi:hypothetical protein